MSSSQDPVGKPRSPPWLPIVVLVAAGALVAAWAFTPLRRILDPQALLAYGTHVASTPFGPLVLLVVYVVAGLLVMPLTLLVAATLVVFGPWPGAPYALVGALVSGCVTFGIGRIAGHAWVDAWLARRASTRMATLHERLTRRGALAIALVRLTPIPYTVVNLFAGAADIRVRDFVIGTAIGLLPVIAILAGVADRMREWLDHPDITQVAELLTIVVVAIALLWMLRRMAERRRT